jgi:hypothetical protein
MQHPYDYECICFTCRTLTQDADERECAADTDSTEQTNLELVLDYLLNL